MMFMRVIYSAKREKKKLAYELYEVSELTHTTSAKSEAFAFCRAAFFMAFINIHANTGP